MRRLRSGRTIVATSGTPVQLSEDPLKVTRINVWPLETNGAVVAIGGPETRVAAGDQAGRPMLPDGEFEEYDLILSEIWIDAETSGEGVQWLAVLDDAG